MRRLSALMAASFLLLAGCAEEDGERRNPAHAPTDYIRGTLEARDSAERQTVLTNINHAVQQFQAIEGRNPRDLDELVTEGYMPAIPEPPRNMEFEYSTETGRVQLVER